MRTLFRFGALVCFALPVAFADGSCWLRDAASPAPSRVYALCEQGTVWVTTDGGVKWSSRSTGTKQPLRAVTFFDANHGLAVGDGGLIVATADAGKTWTPRTSGTTEKLMDVAFAGQLGWASGMNGTVIHTGDGGATWAAQKTGTTQALESIFFLDAQHGWAVGWAGTILRTTDGGATWRQIKTDAAQWSITALCFRDADHGWAVGFAGQILRTEDGGATWKAQKSPTSAWLTSVAFDGRNRGWITYDDGLLLSEDGGATWKTVPVEGRYFLSRLVKVDGAMWALGQSSVLKQTGNGLEWKKIDSLTPDSSMKEPAEK